MCVSILRQAYVASNVRSCTKSGWRKPAVDYQPRCRALPNHGGLTPAAPGWVFDSRCTTLDSRGAAFGSQNHGGPTVAAPVKLAFVHRECRYFPADRRRAPEAAGVSQPCDAGVLVQRKTRAIANASSNHGELTPAALVGVRFRIANVGVFRQDERCAPRAAGVSQPCDAGVLVQRKTAAIADSLPNHGGLTPAAPGWVFDSRCTMFDSRGAAFGSQNHGGLTVAALVNVRIGADDVAYVRPDEPRAPGLQCPCAIRAATVAAPGIVLPLPG